MQPTMPRGESINDAIGSAESTFKQIMMLRGFYWHAGRQCWRKRGVITMQRFPKRNKSVLEHIAETKAKDDAYHLGVRLETQCVNDVVDALTDDPDEVPGIRREILQSADRLISLVLTS